MDINFAIYCSAVTILYSFNKLKEDKGTIVKQATKPKWIQNIFFQSEGKPKSNCCDAEKNAPLIFSQSLYIVVVVFCLKRFC